MFKIEHIQRQKTGTDKQRDGMSSTSYQKSTSDEGLVFAAED